MLDEEPWEFCDERVEDADGVPALGAGVRPDASACFVFACVVGVGLHGVAGDTGCAWESCHLRAVNGAGHRALGVMLAVDGFGLCDCVLDVCLGFVMPLGRDSLCVVTVQSLFALLWGRLQDDGGFSRYGLRVCLVAVFVLSP